MGIDNKNLADITDIGDIPTFQTPGQLIAILGNVRVPSTVDPKVFAAQRKKIEALCTGLKPDHNLGTAEIYKARQYLAKIFTSRAERVRDKDYVV